MLPLYGLGECTCHLFFLGGGLGAFGVHLREVDEGPEGMITVHASAHAALMSFGGVPIKVPTGRDSFSEGSANAELAFSNPFCGVQEMLYALIGTCVVWHLFIFLY